MDSELVTPPGADIKAEKGEIEALMDRITAENFRPRGHYVLLRRLGKVGSSKFGALHMPTGANHYDVCEVIHAGRGTALGDYKDAVDLPAGTLCVIRTEENHTVRGGPRIQHTLTFTIGGEKVELVSEADIYATIDKPQETE